MVEKQSEVQFITLGASHSGVYFLRGVRDGRPSYAKEVTFVPLTFDALRASPPGLGGGVPGALDNLGTKSRGAGGEVTKKCAKSGGIMLRAPTLPWGWQWAGCTSDTRRHWGKSCRGAGG